jgi:hypothetical protein
VGRRAKAKGRLGRNDCPRKVLGDLDKLVALAGAAATADASVFVGSPCDGKEMDLANACGKEFGGIGPHLSLGAGETARAGDDL